MPRRRPAKCAGSPAFLAANGRFRTRSLRSLRHAEPDCSVRCCDTRRHRGRWGGRRTLGACSRLGHRTFRAGPPPSPPPSLAGRTPARPKRAGHRVEGPAASPGSVSWLLLGAPDCHDNRNSQNQAQPAAKPLLKLIRTRCRSTGIGRQSRGVYGRGIVVKASRAVAWRWAPARRNRSVPGQYVRIPSTAERRQAAAQQLCRRFLTTRKSSSRPASPARTARARC